jgi:hypothetical protein
MANKAASSAPICQSVPGLYTTPGSPTKFLRCGKISLQAKRALQGSHRRMSAGTGSLSHREGAPVPATPYFQVMIWSMDCWMDCWVVCKGDVACTAKEISTILTHNCFALLIAHVFTKEDNRPRRKLKTVGGTPLTQNGRSGGTLLQISSCAGILRLGGRVLEAWPVPSQLTFVPLVHCP